MSKSSERVGLGQDERWPTYSITRPDQYSPAAEIDSETLQRWRSVIDAYDAVQDEMAAVYEVAEAEKRKAGAIAKAEKEAAAAQARLEALRGDA